MSPGPGGGYSGGPCQETPCLPPGCPGFLGVPWLCGGKHDAPTPKVHGHPGVSGLGFLWKLSCGLASTVLTLACKGDGGVPPVVSMAKHLLHRRIGYALIAVTFMSLTLGPLMALEQGELVRGLLSAVTQNTTQQNIIARSAGEVLKYFWPPFVGCLFVFLFIPPRILYVGFWPKTLSSFGRGFGGSTHREARIVVAAFAFAGFLLVVVAWSYMGATLTGMEPVLEQTLAIADQQLVEITAMGSDMDQYASLSNDSSALTEAVASFTALAADARDASSKAESFLTSAVYTSEAMAFVFMQLVLVTYAMAFAASLSKRPHLMLGVHFAGLFALLLQLLAGTMYGTMLAIFNGIDNEMSETPDVSAALNGTDYSSQAAEFTKLIAYCSEDGGDVAMGATFAAVASSMANTGDSVPISFPSEEAAASLTVDEMKTFVAVASDQIEESSY
ncbi:unnamed protein product [Prorocentrum cordatum]|uniref:H(+)-exporting diphosphatase n=1 Tax=Prorocentrum cordatum TaxID=2364126 RepID=A0ABN9P6C9_9DINO|nr:unnamed protein product [Polarella glacialis]